MNLNPTLFNHGYRVPIPRSPTIHLQEKEPEEIPGKYAYLEIMGEPRSALKEQFMQNCNQARWKHIRNAEVKAKK